MGSRASRIKNKTTAERMLLSIWRALGRRGCIDLCLAYRLFQRVHYPLDQDQGKHSQSHQREIFGLRSGLRVYGHRSDLNITLTKCRQGDLLQVRVISIEPCEESGKPEILIV